jgi:large subunit ribosomal protein L25
VSNLNIGESFHVRDIPLPSGVEALTDADLTVVSVVASRVGEEVTPTAEAPTTPEVITEKKGEAKPEAQS